MRLIRPVTALIAAPLLSWSCGAGPKARAPVPSPPLAGLVERSPDSEPAVPEPAVPEPLSSPRAPDQPGSADLGTRAWLGVELGMLPEGRAGVLVRGVVPQSPAEQAGILKDDVILSVFGEAVEGPADLVTRVGRYQVGERVGIVLKRGDRERLVAATLEALPSDESMMQRRYVESLAPAFSELKTVQGNLPPSLAPLRGNVVVVEFWAGWCVPCRITAPLLSRWSDRYSAEGLRVVGVTGDPVVEAAEAAARHGMRYPVFSDGTGKTTLSYRAFALPTLFVIDRRGVVRDVIVGFSSHRLNELESLLEQLLAER